MRKCNQTENHGYYCREIFLNQTSGGPDFVIGLYWTLRLFKIWFIQDSRD